MLPLILACVAGFVPQSSGPVEFGKRALERACGAAKIENGSSRVDVSVAKGGEAESFTLSTDGELAKIVGADANGAMYGELELAERIERDGAKAFAKSELKIAPFLSVRAINPFLTLPWDSDKNEPVYDPAALTDPDRWWFHNEDYWTTLLDLMAEARLNQLDIHGAYDIDTTRFPNLYAYFVESKSFPKVGVDKAIKDANLKQLAHVIEMAHQRGIKVSLMSYEAQFYTPHNPKPPYESSEANLYKYTSEVVEAMIRALPELDTIGYRIGESGHGAEFFKCYGEAVKASGRAIPLYTRSWITRKGVVVPLAQASDDFTVEIKFNGEQWGPPYPIAGGRVPGWYSYSFEDYFSDSNVKTAAKMWPGDLADNGEQWPAEPYKIVFQVRANGTHRIFPFYEPDWVRRTVQSMKLGTSRGFTVEMMNSYFPATPRYYLANPKDQWCNWIHQRDAMWLIQWGRLGYDPKAPESVFEEAIEKHLGKDVRAMAKSWKAASRVIPTLFTGHSLGPDHRDNAPELETDGSLEELIDDEPFDSHSVRSIRDELAYRASGGIDGRESPRALAGMLFEESNALVDGWNAIQRMPEGGSGAAKELGLVLSMLYRLSEFHADRIGAAFDLAELEADPAKSDANRRNIDGLLVDAESDWDSLSSYAERFYKPFTDKLRMGTNHYTWRAQAKAIEQERTRFSVPGNSTGGASLPSGDPRSREGASDLKVRYDGNAITVRVENHSAAWLLEKPLPSSTFFHRHAMKPVAGQRDVFEASFPRHTSGDAIAVDVGTSEFAVRIPKWDRTTPYVLVPAKTGPTPLYYSSQEALSYLKPASLDPSKHGMLLICTRAWDFHRDYDLATQRKILDAVKRGMKLLVLQQDYTSGRYPLDWFPMRPVIKNAPTNVFDPGGALGLEKVETDAVLYQPIQKSDGWEVFGNGGIAKCAWGKGEIWLCQARLMQRMHIPGCARNLKKLLELGGREKPTVVIDQGTEGNRYATSVFCDFMNAHDIPFLTLGEVIVDEQGMDSFTKVPGVASADRVLEGKGAKMVSDWLAARMRAACGKAEPVTRDDFEKERTRRKTEFMRALGLDPLPPKTPLNAKVTGVLDRDGYMIEKIVYESRPNFPVTAHLYVPKGHKGEKLPVIVNPNGHWQHKKTEPVVQMRLIDEVRAGYLTLAVDSPGHSFEEDAKIERRGAGTHFDPRNIAGSVTADTIYIWDLIRALDYLETRPEADLTRVGITGVSGGGHATMFAFAADERFTCAVPCCYPSSFLDGWDNGCDCNHVPGYVQVGDRADVIGIRAPAPVFVIGAQDDGEFPAIGTQHTGEKLKAQWKLFGAEDKAWWKLFPGGHDYSEPMREAAIGFFDLYLKKKGDGSPVAELPMKTEDPESPELVCLPNPPADQLTMRDIAKANAERNGRATWEQVVALNGGLPASVPLDFKLLAPTSDDAGQPITFTSETGLRIPGLLYRPQSTKAALVLVHEGGKLAAENSFPIDALTKLGIACLAIDVRGFGELPGLDAKLMNYLGIADSFAMGWDAARAAEALTELVGNDVPIAVVGRGTCGSLVALYAGLMEKRVAMVVGLDALESWKQLFDDDVPLYSNQPRVMYGATLPNLRAMFARPIEWYPRNAPDVDLAKLLAAKLVR